VKRRILFLAMGGSLALLFTWLGGLVIGQQGVPMPLPATPIQPVPPTAVRPAARPQPGRVENLPAPPPPAAPQVPPAGVPQADDIPETAAVPAAVAQASRQDALVSVEWQGPPMAKLGQPVVYQLHVKNNSVVPVQQVVVHAHFPQGVSVQASEPKAAAEGNTLAWDLGTMQPHQDQRIDVQFVPESKGDLNWQAAATFTAASGAMLRVREPKLHLKASCPDKVALGETAVMTLTVNNPGDGSADQVKVRAVLPEGVEHARGRALEFDVGNLGPGESRSVQLICATKMAGDMKCDLAATAEGGLTATDAAVFSVVLPQLDVAVNGPKLRYLDRPASYVLKITNPGSAPAGNVTIVDQMPIGLKFVSASAGGRYDFVNRTVSWFVGDVAAGQSRELTLEATAVNAGEQKQVITAVAAQGIKAEAQVVTHVEALSALLMEITNLDNPVEVGVETAYEIRITNTGSRIETNLQLACTVPEKMEFRGAQGPGGGHCQVQGKEVVFDALPKLAPKADAIYRVKVRGVGPGDLHFHARISADGLVEPVVKEETTKVYGDEAVPH
jgi:uncharacterized repeat protein (TIGR01451 family)